MRRIGFGAMRLTAEPDNGVWRAPGDPSDAVRVLRRAVELGVQLVDTADAYALGQNEELVARALRPYADDLVIATKVGNTRPTPEEWVPLGRPEYLKQQVELSRRRLGVETIDLLQLHRLDPAVPLADQVGALAELQQAGAIRHIGLSEVSVDQLAEARCTATIASVQNSYNLASRAHDPVVDYAAAEGIAFLPFFPLAVGELARPGGVVSEVAAELGVPASQVALAWLLRRSPTIVPIPGTTSVGHLEENVGAYDVRLSDAQMRRLDAAGQEDSDGRVP